MDKPAIHRDVLANFVDLGVQQENIGFANVTMQSENFVCVRESRQSARSAAKILDLRKGVEISEKPISADSIIMNPKNAHMALRALGTIQVFDLDTKAKVASCAIDFDIIFWTWLNESTLAMVSTDFIYKWSCLEDPESEPEVWFEKSDSLDECQIINVQCDPTMCWCLLTGIQLRNGRIAGTIQLYNHAKQLSQMIEAHAGCFFQLPAEASDKSYSLLAFASRTSELKVQVVEIDHPEGLPVFPKQVVDLPLDGMTDNDFPIHLLFDSASESLVLYTKFGHCFLVEPLTGKGILSEKASESPFYLVCPAQNRSSHFVLCRNGDLIKCSTDAKLVLKLCLDKGTQFLPTASRIANRLPIEAQKEAYRNHFDELKNAGKHQEALYLVAKAEKDFLRSFEYMTMIKEFPQVNGTNALLEYFAVILQTGSLNEAETIELAQLALKKNKLELLRKWAADGKIHFSSQLGSLILEADPKLALEVFLSLNDPQNAAFAFCLLGQFDGQFKDLLSLEGQNIDLLQVIGYLNKQNKESCIKFVSFLVEEFPSVISENFVSLLLESDLEPFCAELDLLLAQNAHLFSDFSSALIALFVQRLSKSHPELLLDFLNSSVTAKLTDSEIKSLYELLIDVNQYAAAFCLVTDMESALTLIDEHPDIVDTEYKFLKLPNEALMDLITHLLDQENEERHRFCAILGRFVDESEFITVKGALAAKLTDSELLGFLTFWSSKIKSDTVAHDLIRYSMKLKNYDQVDSICKQVEFSDPQGVFDLLRVNEAIGNQDYKCNGLIIIAQRYNLEAKLISVYADNLDKTSLDDLISVIGIDSFFSLLSDLIVSGIDEAFIAHLLVQAPSQKEILLKAAEELDQLGRLLVLNGLLNSCEWKEEEEVLVLRAKLICLQSDIDAFSAFLAQHKDKKLVSTALSLAEEYCPKAALNWYQREGRLEEYINLSAKLEDWDCLSRLLIDRKDRQLWINCLQKEYSQHVVKATVSNCIHFPDPESASVLVKALVETGETGERLVQLTGALLSENPKFKSSRSLQTLHLLHLIPLGEDDKTTQAIDEFDAYSVEEVVKAAANAKRLDLVLCVLERFEHWPTAFKTAFFLLEDLDKSVEIAEKWNSAEAFAVLFQYHLLNEDAESCLQYLSKLPRLDYKASELVQLLKRDSHHQQLYTYLCHLRGKGLLVGKLESAMFDCLVALDRIAELEEFVSSATPANASSLGFSLARGKKFTLAGDAFIRAGDFDRAVKCLLHTGNLCKTFDSAMKSKTLNVWLNVLKVALKQKQFEMAQKLVLKALDSQPQSAQTIFTIYNSVGAFEELIEVLEVYISLSSAPNRDTLIALGSMYARHQQSSLDAFLTKFHSQLPVTFVNVLAEFRLWKECFNFFILVGDIDRALQVVIGHPQVSLDAKRMAAIIPRIRNTSLFSKLLEFYCDFDPEKFVELKAEFIGRLGIDAVAQLLKARKILFAIEEEVKRALSASSTAIDLYIDSNDYYGLLEAVKRGAGSVDLLSLSTQLSQSPHRHFRVLSGKLAASAGNHRAAIKTLLKEDAIVECLLVLSQTGNSSYCEAFFTRFAQANNAVMFMACAYVLCDSVHLDVLYEWSNRASFQKLALPLICQHLRNRFK